MVLPEMVCAAAVALIKTMPPADTLMPPAVFAFAIDRSLTVLFRTELFPLLIKIPWISPAVTTLALVVPLVMLAMVLPDMETVPVPVL